MWHDWLRSASCFPSQVVSLSANPASESLKRLVLLKIIPSPNSSLRFQPVWLEDNCRDDWEILFPVAVITNDHKPDGSKQQTFTLLHSGGLSVKTRASRPSDTLGEDWLKTPSLPFPASGGSRCFLACGCLTPTYASIFTWLLENCVHICFSSVCYKDTWHWI